MGLPSTSIPMPEGKASRAAVFSEEPTILAAPVRSFWVKQMVTAGMTEAVMATIVAILGWLFAICVPDLAVSLFGGGDAAFTEFAAKCMRIFLLGVFCAGFQIVSANYFQATGQPLKATILSMSRQILLLIPLILILPTFLGLEGILYAGPVADVLAAVVVSFFIVHELRHLGRKAQTQKAQLEQQEQAG